MFHRALLGANPDLSENRGFHSTQARERNRDKTSPATAQFQVRDAAAVW